MTDFHNIERTIADLEGASNALFNVVHSSSLPAECADGLQWLALQIDNAVGDLRTKWEKHRGPILETVKE